MSKCNKRVLPHIYINIWCRTPRTVDNNRYPTHKTPFAPKQAEHTLTHVLLLENRANCLPRDHQQHRVYRDREPLTALANWGRHRLAHRSAFTWELHTPSTNHQKIMSKFNRCDRTLSQDIFFFKYWLYFRLLTKLYIYDCWNDIY